MGLNGADGAACRLPAADGRGSDLPASQLIGDVGPSLTLWPIGSKMQPPRAKPLLPLREEILGQIADRAEEKLAFPTPQRIVHDVRQVMPEDGMMSASTTARTRSGCAQLRTHVADTPCSTMRSRRWAPASVGDHRPRALRSGSPGACRVRRWRLHDQLAGARDGGAVELKLVVLVLVDHAYGMIRSKQAVDRFPDVRHDVRRS